MYTVTLLVLGITIFQNLKMMLQTILMLSKSDFLHSSENLNKKQFVVFALWKVVTMSIKNHWQGSKLKNPQVTFWQPTVEKESPDAIC